MCYRYPLKTVENWYFKDPPGESQGERIKLKTVEGLNTKLPKYILGINSTSPPWFSGLAFVFGGLEIILSPGV